VPRGRAVPVPGIYRFSIKKNRSLNFTHGDSKLLQVSVQNESSRSWQSNGEMNNKSRVTFHRVYHNNACCEGKSMTSSGKC